MKPGSRNGINWITALILSPGVIFTACYLMIWLSTNVYLNHTFRNTLVKTVRSITGQHYQLRMASLKTGPELNSLTIQTLELIPSPTTTSGTLQVVPLRIPELRISCPDLHVFLFSPARASITSQIISKTILEQLHSQLSINERPAPSASSELR